jgi:hypothetical protein
MNMRLIARATTQVLAENNFNPFVYPLFDLVFSIAVLIMVVSIVRKDFWWVASATIVLVAWVVTHFLTAN